MQLSHHIHVACMHISTGMFVLPQNLVSGLSGAAIGAGFSVSTWAPYLCLFPSSVSSLVWIQFTLFLAAFPLAAGLAWLTPRVSVYFWKGGITASTVLSPGVFDHFRVPYIFASTLRQHCCVLVCSKSHTIIIFSPILHHTCTAAICNADRLHTYSNAWRGHCVEPHHGQARLCI